MRETELDIRTPVDPRDQETTEALSAIPPVEFRVTADPVLGVNTFKIQDRQFVAQRGPTVSYRVYFMPKEFSKTIPPTASLRDSGKNVASFVTEVPAPGRGENITGMDINLTGRQGYYFCVAVNRKGIEAPSEHVVAAP